jgi:pepF/M3 family oligoendopeptidase
MKTWNLDKLYLSFDSEKFQEDLKTIADYVEKMDQFADTKLVDQTNSSEKIIEYLKLSEELSLLIRRAYSFCSLTVSVDATNETALKYLSRIQSIFAKTAKASTKFSKWLPTVNNLDRLIETNAELQEFSFYLNRIVDGSQYVLSDGEELLIAQMSQSGSLLWSRMQGELTSTLKVDYEGRQITLSEVRNLATDPSQEVRKNAYMAEMRGYEKIDSAIAYAMNGVKGEVNTISKLRGFKTPLAEAVYKSRMKMETLNTLLDSMKNYLPYFHKYLKRKAKLLGHEDSLPYYDIFAPLGKSNRTFSEEEAMEFIFKQFRSFSPDLEYLAKRAWKEHWIDFTPRNGKRGGAFCSNLHPIKESRIMTNFTGSFGNVITLAHELGHAYHGEQIFKENMLNASYTMPVAETASTFCETIVKNAALKEATKEEQIFLLEQSLKGSTQVIVDIYSRFLFEKAVFEKRKETTLNVRMLKEEMIKAQKEAYGDSLDEEFMNPYAWLNKPHYYSAGLSFYNFPYAFGLLFAKGIYAKYLKLGSDYVDDIRLLLRKTGQMSVEEVAELVGIDLTDKEFWNDSLKVIVKEIQLFLELTQ